MNSINIIPGLKNYYVIVEIGQRGFVSRQYDLLTKAKLCYKLNIMFIPRIYLKDNGKFVLEHLRDGPYTEYSITSGSRDIEITKEWTGNGDYSISLIEIDAKNFNLSSFIKERQNIGFIEYIKESELIPQGLDKHLYAN